MSHSPDAQTAEVRFWVENTVDQAEIAGQSSQWNTTERYTCAQHICTTICLKPAVRNGPALSQKLIIRSAAVQENLYPAQS